MDDLCKLGVIPAKAGIQGRAQTLIFSHLTSGHPVRESHDALDSRS